MGEDYSKVSGFDAWRYINHLDREKFVEQQKKLWNFRNVGLMDDLEKFKPIADILRITEDASHKPKKMLLKRFSLEENCIAGYRNGSAGYFIVEPKQWREQFSDTQILNNTQNNFGINTDFQFCESAEMACMKIIRTIITGNMFAYDYLSLYRIEKGPGDVCLVSVGGMRQRDQPPNIDSAAGEVLSDRRMVFIRGNVAVYLTSNYNDFGCMDLACRLDALIVEQMKKMEQMKKKGQDNE
jgi:hypothetical protein